MHAGEANSTAAQLEGSAWQLLLSRIGDTLMLFLLMHTSLFLPLPHGCYLQAAGACVAQARHLALKQPRLYRACESFAQSIEFLCPGLKDSVAALLWLSSA